MATPEETRLVLQIEANIKSLENALKRAGVLNKQTVESMENDWKGAGNGAEKAAQQIERSISRSSRQAQQATRDLSFQMQDIGQGLMSGTSPFTIMAQQSAQVTMAIENLSGGPMQKLRAVFSGFASMFGPQALAINAIILGLGFAAQAAIKYFSDSEEGSDKAAKAAEKQRDLIRQVADEWGDALPQLKSYNDELERQEDIRKRISATNEAIAKEYEDEKQGIEKLAPALDAAQHAMGRMLQNQEEIATLNEAFDTLRDKIEAGTASSKDLAPILNILTQYSKEHGDVLKPLIEQLRTFAPGLDQAAVSAGKMNEQLAKTTEQFGPFLVKIKEFNQLLPITSQAFDEFVLSAKDLGDLNILPPLTSDMINTQEFQRQAGEFKTAVGSISQSTMDFIKARESFTAEAGWDVDHYRVGWWSDTITDEYGRVTEVVKGMTTTVADANRDLARRIVEAQNEVQSQIGSDVWSSFTENQKTALTSIVYNYGELPSRIVAAIKAGGGSEAVAKAIEALGSDNKGVNRARRKMEAELFGGANFSPEKVKKSQQAFDDLFAANEKRLAQAQRENEINASTTLSIDQKTLAIERNKIAQQLLDAAQQQGLPVNDALKAKIDQQAEAMAQAGLKAEQLAQAQKEATRAADDQKRAAEQVAQAYAQIAQTAVSGFVNDLRQGVEAGDAFRNMLDRVIDGLINMTIEAMFAKNGLGGLFAGTGGGGIGGLFSKLFGVAHSGGIVGKTAFPQRAANPAIFANAPRLHSGLFPGEFPAILQRGEMVIPKNMVGKSAAGGYVDNSSTSLGDINIDMSQTGMVAANSDAAKQFGVNVQKLIQAEMVRESRPGGLLRRVPA
ncbi:hypothetical protein GOC14_06730 [Sinorhizobium meliloti]|nr:hypothetical protein [Sinorhizobium meliloti]